MAREGKLDKIFWPSSIAVFGDPLPADGVDDDTPLAPKPHTLFDDASYYKKVLGNENETAQRLHNLLSKYLTCSTNLSCVWM